MGRYTRSQWSGAEWAAHHSRRRGELTRRFGGIDRDVERIFLNLNPSDLRALLREYAHRYGDGAAAYARSIYPKWRTGAVMLSGQIAERLLDLVPPFLPGAVRYELIRKLRQNALQRLALTVKCEPLGWREAVVPAIERVMEHFRKQTLSPHVTSVATWLTSNDGKATESLLRRAEQEEAKIRTRLLADEFRRIEALLVAYDGARARVEHVIELPQGSVHVTITPLSSLRRALASFFTAWKG